MIASTAHLFPAFAGDYTGIELQRAGEFGWPLHDYLSRASAYAGSNLCVADFKSITFHDNELASQLIPYAYACCMSGYLRQSGELPAAAAGYSMGIYAAAFHAGCYSFDQGLMLIHLAYKLIDEHTGGAGRGLCAIGGLSRQDLMELIEKHSPGLMIINQNSRHSFLLSGLNADMDVLLTKAREEGALQTRRLNVAHPYHTPYLQAAAESFAASIHPMPFSDPEFQLVSAIDGRKICTAGDLKQELCLNLCTPLNWQKCFEELLKMGVRRFVECGPGESLTKMSRFLDGEFAMVNLKNL